MLPPVDEKTLTEEEESTYRVTQHNWYNAELIKLRHCQQNVVMKSFIADMIVLKKSGDNESFYGEFRLCDALDLLAFCFSYFRISFLMFGLMITTNGK